MSHCPSVTSDGTRFWRRRATHLAAQHDLAAPEWAEIRVLQQPWFPAELEIQRAGELVWAPAAFRKHGVFSAEMIVTSQ